MSKTYDGLEMVRMLPEFNKWHDLDVENGAGLAIDAAAAKIMSSAMAEAMVPTINLLDTLSSALTGETPFVGALCKGVSDYCKHIEKLMGSMPPSGQKAARIFAKASEKCVAPLPPIKYMFRRDTSWQNASFRTGSSCWWSSQFKTNWTPGEKGYRTGFAILFAMDRSRVYNGMMSAWDQARARGGKDMYPDEWGPLGRAWVYPAPGGFFVFNTYDDFRDNRSRLNDQTVSALIASILNEAVGSETFVGAYRKNSSTPFTIVHMNSNRCGEVWAKGAKSPFAQLEEKSVPRIGTWENVNWWTIGDNRRGITTAPMVFSFKYSSPVFGGGTDIFAPLFNGFDYIVNSRSVDEYVKAIDPDIKTTVAKMYGVQAIPAAAVRLNADGQVDLSVMPMSALSGTKFFEARDRFQKKVAGIGALKPNRNVSLDKIASDIFERTLPDNVFFGRIHDIVGGMTPPPNHENVASRLELFCHICQAVYESVEETVKLSEKPDEKKPTKKRTTTKRKKAAA